MTRSEAEELGWGEAAQDFANWMNDLDRHLVRLCESTHEDLPDFDFASRFQDKVTPKEVALEMLEELG